MKLTFCGGAGKVTGSNFLIETSQAKFLVDCGIEQGSDFSERDMYGDFPYDPKNIDALALTHAHLDHVGRIPKLVKNGFRGAIYMTPPTADLAKLILEDSINILAEEAKRFNLAPLYEAKDVEETFKLIKTIPYHTEQKVAPGLSIYLRNSGHILGSASVRVTDQNDGTTLVLTGDIGNCPSPLLPDWETIPDADALVMESVYGNRLHPPHEDRVLKLRDTLAKALAKGGTILIPAFSIERTQIMLYELAKFYEDGSLPNVPIYLDSPLAIRVTSVYEKWGPVYFKNEVEDNMKGRRSLFEFPFLTKTLSRRESENIERQTPGQKIIIAGAGMSHGGRIGIWEREYLPRSDTTLIIVGYQAPNSPGRRMSEGMSHVRLSDTDVTIRGEVEILEGWSGHADRDELIHFAEEALVEKRPKAIFTALGEPATERFLAQRIHDYLGVRAVAPEAGEQWDITKEITVKLKTPK